MLETGLVLLRRGLLEELAVAHGGVGGRLEREADAERAARGRAGGGRVRERRVL